MIRRAFTAALLVLAAMPALAGFDDGSFDQNSFSTGSFDLTELVEVPSCTATDEATCVAAIEGAGLVASVVERCSAVVSGGDVIGISPPAGTEVPVGSAVLIRVSTGVACETAGGNSRSIGLGIGIILD